MASIKGSSHKEWAKGKKPSMQRRAEWNDYTSRRIYMITIITYQRMQCLGSLVCPDGWLDVINNISTHMNDIPFATQSEKGLVRRGLSSANVLPFISLSPLGKMVASAWSEIIGNYPQLESLCFQVMPDHIHGIIFVKDRLPLHLGNIIGKFKLLTSKRVDGTLAEVKPLPTQPTTCEQSQSSDTVSESRSLERLWEKGYHDRVLSGDEQMARMREYVRDNPLRLAIKRYNKGLFVQRKIEYAGYHFTAIGNTDLLNAKHKLQVKCSRNMTDIQIQENVNRHLELSKEDWVMVSPCISPGEQAIARSTRINGFPLIVILENGFSEYYKPMGEYFYFCASGNLLMLAPWEHHNEKRKITRDQCLQLNAMAECICKDKI